MWYGARIVITIAGIFYFVSAFITIFTCLPREAIWNPLVIGHHCIKNQILVLTICSFNIISDMTILILPAKAVWNMRLPTRHKIKIVLLFAIGLL